MAEPRDNAGSSREIASEAGDERAAQPLRVLIADDDPLARRVVRDALQDAGMTVVADAANGREAVELALHYRPDLVLMDIVMPVMDGLSAIRRMREIPMLQAVPVIAASASAASGDRKASLAAGANLFVPKPIDHRALLREIGGLLKLRWRRDTSQAS